MRNKRQIIPLTLITLLSTALIAALLLIHYQKTDPTHALELTFDRFEHSNNLTSGQMGDEIIANCRYGLTAAPPHAFVIPQIGAGVFYDWWPDWPYPLTENGAEFMRMIRPRQQKTSTGEYLPDYKTNVPLDADLVDIIQSNPGAVWMIGNEPERGPNPGEIYTARTDDIHADIYAEAYHDIYNFIKGIDPTARIANAGLIQITPMRLQYLDMMWDAYERKFGEPMPVDVWTIHAYVLPELTADGQPNNIASVALGTDPALGKRASGGDLSKCPDPDVYCKVEHDDVSLLEEQIVAMRQWMKEHGQQQKPLVITEYSTLYQYFFREDGTCRIRDEDGECFTPERVSKFMLESFDYFNNARDSELGFPADNNRLVQQWIWYGAWNWDIATSNLLLNDRQTLSLMGETYRNHVYSEPTYVNLAVDEVKGTVVAQDDNGKATAQLSVGFRNNGNVAVDKQFEVTFYRDANMSEQIDSRIVTQVIRGCATGSFFVELEWDDLTTGDYEFWVKLDSDNTVSESSKADNVAKGQFIVSDPVYTLDLQIVNHGEGVGGSVNATPSGGPTYPAGTIVTLSAVPYSGWTFTGWQGAIIGTYPQAIIEMVDDITVQAHFEQNQYKLGVDVIGKGEVTIVPQQDYYIFGDKVTLKAIPASDWRFEKWKGDLISSDPLIELIISDDLYLRAIFREYPYNTFSPLILGDSYSNASNN